MEGYLFDFNLEIALVATLGAFAASFLNVVALSWPDFKKIITGRSACPKCKNTLRWFELIPIVSYTIQFGKCRHCKKPISSHYLWVEILVAIAFALTYRQFFTLLNGWQFVLLLLVLSTWVIIFIHDSHTMYIPMDILSVGVVLTVIFQLTRGWNYLSDGILAALVGFVILGIVRAIANYYYKKEAMGSGDLYVLGLVGLLVGNPQVIVTLVLAVFIGSIIGLVIASKNRKGKRLNLQQEFPFAPSILLGGFLALVYGQQIVQWYVGYLI